VEAFLQTQGGGASSRDNDYTCACVHSDRSVGERRANLESFKVALARVVPERTAALSLGRGRVLLCPGVAVLWCTVQSGEARFLICTDVAARGIDVKGIPYVINFTLPDEKQNYVHRIGRVGRAERMGLAISLVATVPEKVGSPEEGRLRADIGGVGWLGRV
jgi:ATP-dependent RNA helicase DDX1